MDTRVDNGRDWPVRAADYMSVATSFCVFAAKHGYQLAYASDGLMALIEVGEEIDALPWWNMTKASTNTIAKVAYQLAMNMADWNKCNGFGSYQLISWADQDWNYEGRQIINQ